MTTTNVVIQYLEARGRFRRRTARALAVRQILRTIIRSRDGVNWIRCGIFGLAPSKPAGHASFPNCGYRIELPRDCGLRTPSSIAPTTAAGFACQRRTVDGS